MVCRWKLRMMLMSCPLNGRKAILSVLVSWLHGWSEMVR